MNPSTLFRRVAIAEAITWALLLTGMFVKYATEAPHLGELGVRVFGMMHGVVFIAYCLTTVVVAVDQRWSRGRTLLGLAASVPPFLTLWFERHVERRDGLDRSWRLVAEEPRRPAEQVVGWLLRHPARGAVAGVVGVAALTGLALLVGPPTS